MIYRKNYLNKVNLKFLIHNSGNNLNKKVYHLFKNSYQQNYKKRLSYFIQPYFTTQQYQFYKSQNKLICFMTSSPKVPSSKLLLSRFFLVKNINRLLVAGYQK